MARLEGARTWSNIARPSGKGRGGACSFALRFLSWGLSRRLHRQAERPGYSAGHRRTRGSPPAPQQLEPEGGIQRLWVGEGSEETFRTTQLLREAGVARPARPFGDETTPRGPGGREGSARGGLETPEARVTRVRAACGRLGGGGLGETQFQTLPPWSATLSLSPDERL